MPDRCVHECDGWHTHTRARERTHTRTHTHTDDTPFIVHATIADEAASGVFMPGIFDGVPAREPLIEGVPISGSDCEDATAAIAVDIGTVSEQQH